MTTPTTMELLTAKLTELEQAGQASSLAQQREWHIRQEANNLRGEVLIEQSEHFLGRFQWEVMAPRGTSGAFMLQADEGAPGFKEASSDLWLLCGFSWEHDDFELMGDVTIRVDDGDLYLQFPSAERAMEFMRAAGVADRISTTKLDGLIDARREASVQAMRDAEALKAVRNELNSG